MKLEFSFIEREQRSKVLKDALWLLNQVKKRTLTKSDPKQAKYIQREQNMFVIFFPIAVFQYLNIYL